MEQDKAQLDDYFNIVTRDKFGRPLLLKPLDNISQDKDVLSLVKEFLPSARGIKTVLEERTLAEILNESQKSGEERGVVLKVSYRKGGNAGSVPSGNDQHSTPRSFPLPDVFALDNQ